jgi:hypothetical protein
MLPSGIQGQLGNPLKSCSFQWEDRPQLWDPSHGDALGAMEGRWA